MTDQEKLQRYETALQMIRRAASEMIATCQLCRDKNGWTIRDPEYLMGIQAVYILWDADGALVENPLESIQGKALTETLKTIVGEDHE